MSAVFINYENRLSAVTKAVYLALCFIIPLSAAGISIGFGLLAILWLLQGNYRAKWDEIIANPLYVTVLGFFLLHLVGLLWADQSVNGFKSWMIFLIPVWATVVSRETAYKGIYYFVAGMMVAEVGVYYKLVQNWEAYSQGNYANDIYIAMGHISYSPMLALTIAFLCSILLFRKLQGWRLVVSILFLITMTANLFLTGGRAGHVGLLFAGVFFATYYFKRQPTRLLLACMGVALVFFAAYQASPLFKQRADLAVHEAMIYQVNANSGIGLRMRFTENSFALFMGSPLIGYGTGSFESVYQRINEVRSPDLPSTSNPHNYHALVWVQFGLLGFILYLMLYYQQFRLARTLPEGSEFRFLAILLPAFLFIINFSDSYLWGHHTQALFALLMATLYRLDSKYAF